MIEQWKSYTETVQNIEVVAILIFRTINAIKSLKYDIKRFAPL